MHAARAVGAGAKSAMAIQLDRRRATYACAEVVGAMRAGADNAYSSIGARCFGVLAALPGGHVDTVFEGLRATDGGELKPAANTASRQLRTN